MMYLYRVRFFIELPTRVVRIAGITTNPAEAWTLQTARNACDAMLMARSPKAGGSSLIGTRRTRAAGAGSLKSSAWRWSGCRRDSPNLNVYAERFAHSIKDECLNRMIFIGEVSLRRAIREFMAH